MLSIHLEFLLDCYIVVIVDGLFLDVDARAYFLMLSNNFCTLLSTSNSWAAYAAEVVSSNADAAISMLAMRWWPKRLY